MGLFLHLHPSPPSCPRRELLSSTRALHRGDPDPRRAQGLGLRTPQFRDLARCWAPASPPGLALTSRGHCRPPPVAHPECPPLSGAACFPTRWQTETWSGRCGLLSPAKAQGNPGNSQERRLPPGRVGGALLPVPSLPSPASARWDGVRLPHAEPPRHTRRSSPSSVPLPVLAPYLEKQRDFPTGQIFLGIVGVHGSAARALGAGGEASGCGYLGWGWRAPR